MITGCNRNPIGDVSHVRNPLLEYFVEREMSAPMLRAWVASISIWGSAAACFSLGIAALLLGDSATARAVGVELMIVGGWLTLAPFTNLMRIRPNAGFIVFSGTMMILAVIGGLVLRSPWLPLFFTDLVIVGSLVLGLSPRSRRVTGS